jgi:hypothetical protein
MRFGRLCVVIGALFTLTIPAAEPAWITVPTSNRGTLPNLLLGVTAPSSGSTAWAVGSWYDNSLASHRTMIQRWDGSQWTAVASPNVGKGYNVLSAVSATSDSSAWAVGYQQNDGYTPQQSLVLRWNGSTWQSMSVPHPGTGAYQALNGVAALAPNDVWAVGWYYETGFKLRSLALHWDGAQWRAVSADVPNGAPNQLMSIAAAGPADIWAGGTTYQNGKYVAMIQHWDGSRWQAVPLPALPSGASAVRGLSVSPTGEVWAIGDNAAGMMVLRWDGSQWSLVTQPRLPSGSGHLGGVVATGASDVWVAGFQYDSAFRPLVLHWDGAHWTQSAVPASGAPALAAVAATPSSTLLAVGSDYSGNTQRTFAVRGR